MNTPAHLIFGAAAFARADQPKITTAALLGSLTPDVSLYLMASWHLYVLGTPAHTVFGQLYYSNDWMRVFAVDNSFLIWGTLFAMALWFRRNWLMAFAGAGLLHLAFDFPFHHDDGRPQFWPVTDWVFESPLSYWDTHHYGNILGPLEAIVCLVLLGVLWHRFKGRLARCVIALAAAFQLLPMIIWFFVFR